MTGPRTSRTHRVGIVTTLVLLVAGLLAVPGAGARTDDLERPPPRSGFARLNHDLVGLIDGTHGRAPDGPGMDFIEVEIIPMAGAADVIGAIDALGGRDVGRVGDLVTARVPVARLAALDSNPAIGFVRPATRPIAEVTGEGVAFTGADDWHAAGYTGTGVKVAVIDGGFSGYAALLGTELPASPVVQNYCNNGFTWGGQHGTAVAEIVHDMAPDATLYLICIDDLGDLADAVDFAVAEDVDVISHSMGWFNTGRGDGTGYMEPIVTAARDGGILWVNSGGNYADEHWSGTFVDADIDGLNEFTGTDETIDVDLAAGETLRLFLRWDAWPVTSLDYDLLLYDSGLTLIDWSDDEQSGTQPPTESLSYTNTTGSATTVHIAIEKYSGPAITPRIDLMMLGGDAQAALQIAAGSLVEPAASPIVTAVGAVYVGTGVVESFSSRGPTIDGRTKPDVSAPDGTTSVAYGGFGFFGTSAAAPHAAGMAALLKEARPAVSPAELATLLESVTTDAGAVGPDNAYGVGVIEDVAVLDPVGPVTGILDPGFESGSVNASPHGFDDGGGSWVIENAAARSESFGASYDSSGQTDLAVLELNGPRDDGSNHLAVSPGQAVGFSIWARSDSNGTVNRVRPRITFFTAAGSYIDGVSHLAFQPGTAWEEVSISGIAPPATAFVTFEVRIHDDGNGGVFDFDDAAAIGPVTPTASVTDGGFESGTLDAHDTTTGGGVWDATSSVSHSGSHAARFDSTSQTSMGVLWVNGPRGAAADHVPVSSGDVVGFTAWIRSDGATNRMRPRIHFYDGTGGYLTGATTGSVVPTTSWQQVGIAGLAPPGAAYAILQLRVHDNGSAGEYYIDDVALVGVEPAPGEILDPGFESGTFEQHATTAGGGTWAVTAGAARSGSRGASFDPAGQTDLAILWANGKRSDPDHVQVGPGELVGFSTWVRSATATKANRVRPRIHFYDSDGGYLEGVTMNVTRPGTTWQQITVAGITPPGTAYAIFQIRIHDDGFSPVIHIDDLFPTG